MFPDPKERTFAIGVWISSFSAGGAIGPLVGGVLLTWFWWGSVFLIAVPVMILLLVLAPVLLPEFRDPQAGRLDIPSAALSLVSVLAIIWALKHFAEYGVGPLPIAALVLGLAVGGLFLRRQRRLADPFVDLALFRIPAFGASLIVNVLGFFAAFGTFLLVAQYLQLVLGLTPLQAGLVTAPSSAGFIAGSMLAPRLIGIMRPAFVMAGGYAVAALGFLLLAQTGTAYPISVLLAGFTVLSLGLAPVFTLATELIIGSAPAAKAGSAAGLAETSSEFGGALGIAVLGSLVVAFYRTTLVEGLPDGLPQEVVAAARDTVGTAIAEAARLGGSSGEAVALAARTAYSGAFELATTICAAVSLAAALAAALLLRGAGSTGDAGPAACEEPATG
jgi:DHA2 family multidrug resistance protein-like MFS transporter